MSENNFLKNHQDAAEREFWQEKNTSFIMRAVESVYKREVIRDWVISDIVTQKDKVLVKWEKRIIPLTDQELKEKGFK